MNDPNDVKKNGWTEWSKHVLLELGRLDANDKDILKAIDKLKEDVVVLKTKSGIYGAIAGAIIALLFQVFIVFLRK